MKASDRLKELVSSDPARVPDVADALGVVPSTLWRICSGLTVPSLATAVAIERRYGLPCSVWAAESPESPGSV